jgi:hypothetical protein
MVSEQVLCLSVEVMTTMEEGNFLENIREAICIFVVATFGAEREIRAGGVGVAGEASGVGVVSRVGGIGGVGRDGGVVGMGPTGGASSMRRGRSKFPTSRRRSRHGRSKSPSSGRKSKHGRS